MCTLYRIIYFGVLFFFSISYFIQFFSFSFRRPLLFDFIFVIIACIYFNVINFSDANYSNEYRDTTDFTSKMESYQQNRPWFDVSGEKPKEKLIILNDYCAKVLRAYYWTRVSIKPFILLASAFLHIDAIVSMAATLATLPKYRVFFRVYIFIHWCST